MPKAKQSLFVQDPDRYLAVRGVDQCKMREIVNAGLALKHKGLETPQDVLALLEKNSIGGLAQTVERVHANLLAREKIIVSGCANVPSVKPRDALFL